MAGWSIHEGLAVGLPFENVDTDQLIPARFMSRPRSAGYGDFLLHDMRRDGEALRADFPLNRTEALGASILVARRNFGSGSSREAAVYALFDAGFKVVLAPTFGDIFARNAVNNGLLPARLPDEAVERLLKRGTSRLRLDLKSKRVSSDGFEAAIDISDRDALLIENDLDAIGMTLSFSKEISEFKERYRSDGLSPSG